MPKLEEIKDQETLQQAAILLEKTVIRLNKENAKLRAENARLRGQDVDPQMELELLKEQLAAMQKKLYAPSSEKRPKTGAGAKDETQRRGHGPRPQPDLPIEEVTHTLPEDERTCSFCGGELEEMKGQSEDSEEITVVELSYKVVKHQRQKYRCRCNAQVVTAPGPDKLIPGGRYSIELAVHVAEKKYVDHMPLERQVKAMGRRGFLCDSQTLWDQTRVLYDHLVPSYEALCRRALSAEVALADETFWKLRILNSRSTKAAAKLLGDFEGIVMTDGYGAYQSLARAGPKITLAHCWAHVRRKYLEAADAEPKRSEEAMDLIGRLFDVERQAPKPDPNASSTERKAALALRRKLRDEQSRPVVKQLLEWALANRGDVLPRSKMGKAIAYMLNLWEGLTRFLDEPRVPLDNNGAERALRGVVVGRKNHYGSRSKTGTQVAALFYTLFESAKLSQVDPHAYVLEAAKRAIRNPGTVTLPHDLI
jgi:transposase